jgi:hypothetical protein
MQQLARAEFFCTTCGDKAGEITVINNQLHMEFLGRTTYGSGWQDHQREQLPALIAAGDVRGLHALDALLTPFYCPHCDSVYCREHWQLQTVFDDEIPGWYDCTYGTCPAGHRRIVDD